MPAESPDPLPDPAQVRAALGVTPAKMAWLLHVPIATWIMWEAGLAPIEPATQRLLAALWQAALAAGKGSLGG